MNIIKMFLMIKILYNLIRENMYNVKISRALQI